VFALSLSLGGIERREESEWAEEEIPDGVRGRRGIEAYL
jgi:hypothetical protein